LVWFWSAGFSLFVFGPAPAALGQFLDASFCDDFLPLARMSLLCVSGGAKVA
jgi:hypothetical protein